MTRRFGDRATFAIEVGPPEQSAVRAVDLYAGGRRLTCHDNAAYVPPLVHRMRSSADLVRGGKVPPCPFPWQSPAEVFRLLHANDSEFRERFWLLRHWDEILDDVETYTWLDDELVVAYRIHRPVRTDVFVARIPPDEWLTTIDEAAGVLIS